MGIIALLKKNLVNEICSSVQKYISRNYYAFQLKHLRSVSQSSCTAFGKDVSSQDYFGFVKKKNVQKSLNTEE